MFYIKNNLILFNIKYLIIKVNDFINYKSKNGDIFMKPGHHLRGY
jgi:hypothetical protein